MENNNKVEPCSTCKNRHECGALTVCQQSTGAFEADDALRNYCVHATLVNAKVINMHLDIKIECTRYAKEKKRGTRLQYEE